MENRPDIVVYVEEIKDQAHVASKEQSLVSSVLFINCSSSKALGGKGLEWFHMTSEEEMEPVLAPWERTVEVE